MTGSDGSVDGEESGNAAGAPEIVNLEASMDRLSERIVAVTITAQVVDPDGLDDIVGGLAHDTADDALIGPFAQLSGGTFELGLTWIQLDAIGKTDDTDVLRITVEFTDTDGNADEAEIDVLVCTEGHDACPDECTALNVEGNCGACGVTCQSPYNCRDDGFCCYAGQYAEYCQPSADDDSDEVLLSPHIPSDSYSPYFTPRHETTADTQLKHWRL